MLGVVMGLEVFYPADIRNALLAAEQAANATVKATGNTDDVFASGYLAGYWAALTTIALAFGLASNQQHNPLWPRLPTLVSDGESEKEGIHVHQGRI